MGKSIPSAPRLQQFARDIASASSRSRSRRQLKAAASKPSRPISCPDCTGSGPDPHQSRRLNMEPAENSEHRRRVPLAEVVADCVRRWFQDTLKEAKNGDTTMQVLVGQMYYSGYGVAKDPQKGRAWISKASKIRSSVWKVGDKRPGYNASDSDSDDVEEDTK
ncbi:uncharacterized protein LOC127256440 [Andrographis paniculata]|uniref:uncharacterized protein LOC127256440 n=1 Tax=Andrographis paniculata TaxID=175694 RepID=UPI0021E76DC7|nr:uncharacterized protein LOC127256440 [Andrographis paniculata]